VNANGDGLARGLVLGDSLDVDDVFETVDGGDLSFTALVRASDNEDFVILADRDGSDLQVVLGKLGCWSYVYEHCASRGAPCSRARS
jgi:hypothetical protein